MIGLIVVMPFGVSARYAQLLECFKTMFRSGWQFRVDPCRPSERCNYAKEAKMAAGTMVSRG
jgi:hypothetical protein